MSAHSARYRVARLVHVETTADPRAAITREKQLKGWARAKKLALVAASNPGWDDLAPSPDDVAVQVPILRRAQDDNAGLAMTTRCSRSHPRSERRPRRIQSFRALRRTPLRAYSPTNRAARFCWNARTPSA